MRILFSLGLVFYFIALNVELNTACTTILACKNNGTFNNLACQCECFPNYNGDSCQNILCNIDEPTQCLTFNKGQCQVDIIKSYCPKLCEVCPPVTTKPPGTVLPSLPPTVAPPPQSSAPPPAPTTKCPTAPLTCLNGGQWSAYYCLCDCLPLWGGNTCQTLYSAPDPAFCSLLGANNCNLGSVKYACPGMCGYVSAPPAPTSAAPPPAPTTQPPPPVSTSCTQLSCINGGSWQSNTCSCLCLPSYTGATCSTLNCSGSDLSLCTTFSKADCSGNILAACPIMCGKCTNG